MVAARDFDIIDLASTGTTGNNTHNAVSVAALSDQMVVEFIVEAAGAGPTITWKVQGSFDGTNWFDAWYTTDSSDTAASATRTATAVGSSLAFLKRPYKKLRLVTTLNTNITYRAQVREF